MWPTISTYAFLALGAGFAACGIGAVWWALFHDKARGRRRCPRCWHDLTHTSGLVCSECGFAARAERLLHRTRRRWWSAAAATAVLVGTAVWARMQVSAIGWPGLLPSPVLVGLTRLMEPPGALDEGWRELRLRVMRRELSPGTQLSLAATLASMSTGGLLRAAPADLLVDLLNRDPQELVPNDDETESEAELRERARTEYRAALDAEVERTPLTVQVSVPPTWNPRVPLTAVMEGVLWGQRAEWRGRLASAATTPVDDRGAATGPSVQLEPMRDIWLVWNSVGFMRSSGPTVGVLPVRPLPAGTQRLTMTVEIQTRRWQWAAEAWGPWKDSAPVSIAQVIDCREEAPLPIREDPSLAEAMKLAFGAGATTWNDDARPVGVRYNPGAFSGPEHADVLVGVTVDLLENGQLRRRNRFWWRGGMQTRLTQTTGWLIELEDLEACKRLRESSAGWTLRVTGDAATALLARPRTSASAASSSASADSAQPQEPAAWRVWEGSIEQPLSVFRSNSPLPDRIWRIEPR